MRNAGLHEAQAVIKIAKRNINSLKYADDTTLMAESEGLITSWEIDGETVETVSDFTFWGSKITADGDCSHEVKRRLLLVRKAMTNLDITLPTKVRLV